MAKNPNPLRRVVTGHDASGRSCVIFDSDAPNVYHREDTDAYFTDFWTINRMPALLAGQRDEGSEERTFSHSPPRRGAHFRIVQSGPPRKKASRDQKLEADLFDKMNTNRLSELKIDGPAPLYHRTPTVDYAFNFGCDRYLILDDSETVMKSGDVVVQLGNFHTWVNRIDEPGIMGFDMIGGFFPDEREKPSLEASSPEPPSRKEK
jgi:hypothetical protein